MKKILILLAVALISGCTANQTKPKELEVDSATVTLRLHRDKYMDELMLLIRYFDHYYHSTEELLDSAGIDATLPVMHSLTGYQYLRDRDQLNELFNELEYNSNHKHISK